MLVAEHDGRVCGFARLSEYSDRCVYQGIGEHGVYVGREARGHGLGRALLDALADEAARRGYYKLTSRIFSDNEASLAAHRAAGFVEVGVQRRHGRLDGEWKDCVLVERLIGDAAGLAERPSCGALTPDDARSAVGRIDNHRYESYGRRVDLALPMADTERAQGVLSAGQGARRPRPGPDPRRAARARRRGLPVPPAPLFDLSQPTLCHHLHKLADAGLIAVERRGKWAYYSVEDEALEVLRSWLS